MNIKCPKCHARASLPDSKLGAKVKCGECGRIFVAAPIGARNVHSGGMNTGALIGIGVAVVAFLGFLIVNNRTKDDPAPSVAAAPAKAQAAPEQAWIDPMSWDGPIVQAAVEIHDAAAAFDTHRVRRRLDAARIYGARALLAATAAPDRVLSAAEAAEAAVQNVAVPSGPSIDIAAFADLSPTERDAQLDAYANELLTGASTELVAAWKPFDSKVSDLDDDFATVRLFLSPRAEDGGVGRRTIDWHLAKDPITGLWRAYHWARWYSLKEQALVRSQNKGFEKVTLSDGSRVLEREPEPLEHLESTPADVRARIDSLYATMVDLDLTKEAMQARADIVDIGRPAIPILLTGLFNTPLDTDDNAIIANIIVTALRDITDQYFGYEPQILAGSAAGTTEERRASAIKQWFAWWHLNEKKFDEKEERVDGLEGLIELDEKEKAWLERDN